MTNSLFRLTTLPRTACLLATALLAVCFYLKTLQAQQKGGSKPAPTPAPAAPHRKASRPKHPEPRLNTAHRARLPEIALVWLNPGEFTMGADGGGPGESPAHTVTLTKGFFLGKYEVTQAQWAAVMGYNPSEFAGRDLPVDNVSWERVQIFLRTLNQLDRRYNYRLPTEAEWEYACRAGTTEQYAGPIDELAWHANNATDESTYPVGAKKPNAWGLYDMHGNVWEWCQDWLDWKYYANSPPADPPGPATGELKVFRGGAWDQFPLACRSSHRYGDQVNHRDAALGLRVAADKR